MVLTPTTEATGHKAEHEGWTWHRNATQGFRGFQAKVWTGETQATGPVEKEQS